MRHRVLAVLLLFAAPLVVACEAEEPADEVIVETTPPVATTDVAQQTAAYPDTTADAVWSYLQEQNYDQNWRFWPEKEPFYEGVEPHGLRLNTYLNPVAYDALTARQSTMPERSIIVKENYTPDSTLVATTVMYKVPGYDPDNNNWWWLKRNADGQVEGAGRVDGCINCHSGAADNDYILTATLESGGTQITDAARAAKQGGGGSD